MKSQPVIELPKSATEGWLDVASWIIATVGLALAIGYFPDLPDQIPTHFNGAGKPDNSGPKLTVFLLPVLSLLLAGGMSFLSKHPHKFNYLNKITPENAPFEYRKARLMVRLLSLLVSLLFTVLTWDIIRAATGSDARLGMLEGVLIAATLIVPAALMIGWRDKSRKPV